MNRSICSGSGRSADRFSRGRGLAWLIASIISLASDPTHGWVARHGGPGPDFATSIAVGPAGTVYVTGASKDTLNGFDIVTLKYDAIGALIWERSFDGPAHGDDIPSALSVGSDGSVYVTGASGGLAKDSDCITLKYTSHGTPIWAMIYAGVGDLPDRGDLITIAPSGDIVVAGTSYVEDRRFNQLVIQYTPGGVESWSRNDDGGSGASDVVMAMIPRLGGGVFTAGIVADTAGLCDVEVRAISPTGTVLWSRRYDGPTSGDDWPLALAANDAGDVYVSGVSAGSLSADCLTEKLSASGDSLWAARFSAPSVLFEAGVAAWSAPDGGVYVAGVSSDSLQDRDFLTLRYSPSGELDWVRTFSGLAAGIDEVTSMTIDAAGRVIVSGASEADTTSDSTRCDYTTIAFSPTGDWMWRWTYDGPASGYDSPAGIVSDGTRALIVTGASDGVGTGLDFATIRFDSTDAVTTVLQPLPGRFNIQLASRNPGPGPLELVLAYPSPGDVTFTVVDVQGRGWPSAFRKLRLGAGTHRVRLGGDKWPNGVYFLRVAGRTGETRIDRLLKYTVLR